MDRILENILYVKMLTTHKQIINLIDIKHHSRFQNKMILRNQTTFEQFPHHEIEMLKFVFWFVFLGLFFIILLIPSHVNSKNIFLIN